MKQNKRKNFLLLIPIIAIGLVGCASKTKEANKPIKLAFFPNITHTQALVGKNKGTFEKAFGNATVEYKQFNAGSAELEALMAGEVDLGYIGPIPAINGFVKSKGDIVIVGNAANYGAALVTRADLKLNSLKELENKTIAIPQFGNTQDLVLRGIIDENAIENVKIIQSENPDIKTLLDKKEIDGALVPEPWATRLIKESKANMLLDYDKVYSKGEYPTTVLVARKEFIQNHKDQFEAFLKANKEITKYINDNKSEAIEIVNAEINNLTKKPLPKDVIEEAFKRLTVTSEINEDATKGMVDLLVKAKFIREKVDLKDLFYK